MVASGNANDSPASATTKLPALTTASTPTPVAGSDAGRTSAFISYSRRDQEFVRALDDALVGRGFRVWVDWEDIPYGADFPSAILDNIEQNDTFLFVLSPDSLASEWCGKELAHAEENKKRIMPVVCRDVDLAHVPSALGHLNWLFMRTSDPFAQALDKLDTAITTDLDWVKAHSWLLQRAGRWDRAGRNASLLMRGKELQEADGWLAQASINRSKRPTPVQLQADYIIASRRTQRTRHRAVVAAISSVAVLALLLASVAWREKVIANQQRAVAVGEKKEVVRQQQLGRSRELAAEALAQLPTNPERGALLADQAVRRYPLTREAEAALRQASGATRVRAILYGHGDKVYDVAYSADGSRILTASRDETARVWDARTGREVVLLAGHVNTVTTAVFSPDRAGRYILTASWDGTARVWDARTGRSLRTLKVLGGRVGDVVSAAFSQDGRKIVTASADGTARVWAGDARAGASPVSPVTLRGHGCVHDAIATAGRDCTVYSALFSPGGFRVVTAGVDGTARVWDARTGHQLLILRVPTSWVYRALYSPDGKHIATAGGDGTARVWDATTGKLVATLTGHTGAINDLAFSPDGARLVTAGVDRTARVWTIATRQATMLSGHTDAVGAAMFSPNDGGARVLTVSNDHSARVWDAATGQELFALRGHTNAVDSGAFSPDGARVATASYDKTARTWDVSTGRIVASWPKGKATPDDFAAYSPDGNYVLTAKPGVAGLTANLWDAHSGGKPFTLTGHTQSINALSFDQRATKVATASDDGTVRVWAIRARQPAAFIGALHDPTGAKVKTVNFSPDGRRVVAGDAAGAAYVWDLRRIGRGLPLGKYSGMIVSAAFSRDSKRIVTGGDDGAVRVWDAATGKEWRPQSLAPPVKIMLENRDYDAEFSPNGALLVTADASNGVQLWDTRTGQNKGLLSGHTSAVISALFSPDGRYIVTASLDGTARVWDVATRESLEILSQWSGPLPYATFTPDGRRIIAAGVNGRTSIYACDVCAPPAELLAGVRGHVAHAPLPDDWTDFAAVVPPPDTRPSETLLEDLFDGYATGILPLVSPYSSYAYSYGWDAGDGQHPAGAAYVVRKVDPAYTGPIAVTLPQSYADAVLAVDARLLKGQGDRVIDLGCRQSEDSMSSQYRASVYPDGDVYLVRWLKGVQQVLAHVVLKPHELRPGDAWNRLALSCVGQRIAVGVNDKTVIAQTDPTFRSGLMWFGPAISNDTGRYTVEAHFRRLEIGRP